MNLDAMRVKVWPGWASPPGTTRPVRFFGETLDLEVAFDAGNTVELTAGNGDRIQLLGPGHRYFEFYRSHGDSTVPRLEVDDLDQARPSWPAAAPSYSASRSQTAPGPGSPSGRPAGTSTAWSPATSLQHARPPAPRTSQVFAGDQPTRVQRPIPSR